MFSDRERPARIRAEQQRAFTRYVRREVVPYSDHERARLERSGLDAGRLRTLSDLALLPPVTLEELRDPAPLVLRPTDARIRQHADLETRARLVWARLWGREDRLARGRIDPVFKPVHWAEAGGLLVASSAADLDRLAELGRRGLEAAGVRPYDVLVSLVPPGPDLGFWQLALAARRAGLSSLYLSDVPSAAEIERLRPTVLTGSPGRLARLVDEAVATGASLGAVRVVIAVGDPQASRARRHVARMLPAASVTAAWAPAGVRSLWFQCERGTGLHTSPQAEVVELLDDAGQPVEPGRLGEVVWSPIGWRGTVALRLRTGLVASLDDAPCPSCGRTTPRIQPAGFPEVLDASPALAAWHAEVRRRGDRDELVVFATTDVAFNGGGAALTSALRTIDDAVGVTQFVIADRDEVDRRVAASGGRRVVVRS